MADKRNKKVFFFPSVYMKMNWTFNYLKVMGRIQPIFWKKNEKKKRKKVRKKTKTFPFIYFSIRIYENELGESANLLTLFWFCLIGQGNVLEIRLSCKKFLLTRQNKWKMAIVNEGDKKKSSKLY